MNSLADLPGPQKCRRQLEIMVFGPDRRCPRCQAVMHASRDYLWCRSCRKKWTAKAVTWLRGSNLSYRQLLALVLCWQKKVPPGSVVTTSGLSYPTIARWYGRFRNHLPEDTIPLMEDVEADESFHGRKKYANQVIVMGAIERATGRRRLREIPDREQDSLELFLHQHVHPATTLYTDAWSSYYDIEWYGYRHIIANHSKGVFGPTARAENLWSVSKRSWRRMYGRFVRSYLLGLLREWEARANFPGLFTNPFTYFQGSLVPN